MSPEIGKYCGDKIPKQIPSQSNKIYLQFSSDFSKNRKGFYIKWSATASGKVLIHITFLHVRLSTIL